MKYFDAHCHVQFDAYNDDRDAVVARMNEEGIAGLVVGTDAATSRAACEFVQEKEGLFASVGQHPNHAGDENFDEHLYRNLLMYPKTVAIGECGLDYYRPADATDDIKRVQKALFLRQVRLAGQTKRPLIIHARPTKGAMDAYDDALDMLAEAKQEFGEALKGDFHFFVGDTRVARRAFELDFTLSYTAVVTFARDYDEVIRFAPLDRILTETDAPYVAPVSRRGQRNDPLSIPEIVAKLAEVRGEDPEMLRAAVAQNAERLFALSQWA